MIDIARVRGHDHVTTRHVERYGHARRPAHGGRRADRYTGIAKGHSGSVRIVNRAARTNAVLFLFHEVLGGTNSCDRFHGAKVVLEQLIANGAVGLLTTHDLALTELSRTFAPHALNIHFEEHYENGEMRFDYLPRPGVLTRTNGLNVMAALGITLKSAD